MNLLRVGFSSSMFFVSRASCRASSLFFSILFELTISNQDINGIFEVDAVLCSMDVALVEPIIFRFICVELGRCLLVKLNPFLAKLCVGTFEKNILSH